MPGEKTYDLFVYGTLRKGEGNYRPFLEGKSEFLGEDTVPFARTHPLILKENLPGETPGEIYRINEDTLARIDWLENNGEWYQRKEIVTNGGKPVWVYFHIYGD